METLKDLKLKGSWNELKGKLKQEYGELTEDDLAFAEGKEEELIGRLQTRLGLKRDEVINKIREKVKEL